MLAMKVHFYFLASIQNDFCGLYVQYAILTAFGFADKQRLSTNVSQMKLF